MSRLVSPATTSFKASLGKVLATGIIKAGLCELRVLLQQMVAITDVDGVSVCRGVGDPSLMANVIRPEGLTEIALNN